MSALIEHSLKSQGYSGQIKDPVYGKDGVINWYKRVPGTNLHQFLIRMWPPLKTGWESESRPTFEIEMTYETRAEIWARTKFYGLSFTELTANLERLEGCLKSTLMCMDANLLHYNFDGKD